MKQMMPTPSPGFDSLATGANSYAETGSLAPDERQGGPDHALPGTDRWVYVLDGTGRAVIEDEAVELRPGIVLLIEADEQHELHNTGDAPLEMLNIYAP